MKKLSVILVLAIFLLSMVPAFAKNDDAGARNKPVPAVISENQVKNQPIATAIQSKEAFMERYRERVNTQISECTNQEDEEACKQRIETRLKKVEGLKERSITKLQAVQEKITLRKQEAEKLGKNVDFSKYNKNLEFKARALDKIKVEKARNNFLKAKDNFQKAREKYQNAHSKFNEAKNRLGDCAADDESEICVQARNEIQTRARESLMHIADQIIEHLNKLKEKAESNEDLSEEEAKEIIDNINEKISEIEEAKAKIEAAETKEDVKEAGVALKGVWGRVKIKAKEHAVKTVNARIGGIIVKSKQLEVKLQRILERMTENGQDTSVVEPLVEQFNTKIEEAKTHYEMAQEKFKEGKAKETANAELVKEAQTHMKEAHAALQEAQKLLRDIVLSIKQAGASDELEEVSEEK